MMVAVIPGEFRVLLLAEAQYLQIWVHVQVQLQVWIHKPENEKMVMKFLLNLEEPALTDLLHSRRFGCLLYLIVLAMIQATSSQEQEIQYRTFGNEGVIV